MESFFFHIYLKKKKIGFFTYELMNQEYRAFWKGVNLMQWISFINQLINAQNASQILMFVMSFFWKSVNKIHLHLLIYRIIQRKSTWFIANMRKFIESSTLQVKSNMQSLFVLGPPKCFGIIIFLLNSNCYIISESSIIFCKNVKTQCAQLIC